ncbi:MAG: MBL fold metallo-hydrolase [Methanomicrobiales archaeon]|nr:MBL fold metallo-hydrolase [Methanomicrobiales archaeon]
MLETGRRLKATTGSRFHADVQEVELGRGAILRCIQPPCGGNIYTLSSRGEWLMVDAGFGIYHREVAALLAHRMPHQTHPKCIVITHGDPDHAGGAGFFAAPAFVHRATKAIMEQRNRAFASRMEGSVLESVYTRLLCEFSRFRMPPAALTFGERAIAMRGVFPVLDRLALGEIELEILEGLGGHLAGHVYLFAEEHGILFSGDTRSST